MSWRRVLTMTEVRGAMERGEIAPDEPGAWPWCPEADDPQGTDALVWRAPAPDQPVRLDPTRPLAGFAVAVKANICVLDQPAHCGSRILDGWRAPYDATAVARLRAAGATFAGTPAMDEFGMGSTGEHAHTGPTANPWRADRTPGGSSSGSAAAVARGLAWYALGSDTGGSVRLPAHCCGLVGLKPTWGRVPRHGLVAFASSLDTIGVLARGVDDAGLVLATMSGGDPGDATCADLPFPETVMATPRRLAVPRALVDAHASPEVAALFDDALDELRQDGATISNVDLPGADVALAAYTVLAAAEAASNLARFDGSLYGARREGADYGAMVRATRTAGFGAEVKRRILLGTGMLASDHRAGHLERARGVRHRLGRAFAEIFARHDVLILPTAPTTAVALGAHLDDPVAMYGSDVFTVPASLAGLPAISVPMGCAGDGLPVGLQIVGAPWAEGDVLALARHVERARGFRHRKEAPWHRTP